jgi:hypothetical protein
MTSRAKGNDPHPWRMSAEASPYFVEHFDPSNFSFLVGYRDELRW